MRQTPYLSIVIPAYKAEGFITSLLDSIFASSYKNVEVIVVDDCSPDGTEVVVRGYGRGVKYHCLRRNAGPAKARNVGARMAKGKILLFLDADVLLYKNTLREIASCYQRDLDLHAMTGVWSKTQKSRKFFPRFKALRDWSYWINERDQRGYYYLFSTRIASINRELFLRLGGFDERYRGALVEDIEFTYRIAKRYAVVFNPRMKVKHEFEDFGPIAKKYMLRTQKWSRLYFQRRKFDPVATTKKEFIVSFSAAAILGFLVLGVFWSPLWWLSLLALIIHLWGVSKFLWFVWHEEDLVFMIKSFFVGWLLYLIILTGGGLFVWELVKNFMREKISR